MQWLAPDTPVPINVDSGWVENASSSPAVLFATTVSAPDAAWLRVAFDEIVLPDPAAGVEPAHLRLTSLRDGAVQVLDRGAGRQWKNTSAYFNGDAVLVELVSPPGAGPCRVVIGAALRDAEVAVPRNTCGATDDRVPSNDPRVARLLPIGCTGWLIRDANYCFLTAGHCAGGLQVAEFNVPLSNANGSLNHPPPQDQYAVDPASIQSVAPPIVIGNDWAYYGVFPNSTSGLTAYESQGDAFPLTQTTPVATGQTLVKTGFGTTDPPVSNTLNQVQKTLSGPLSAVIGNALRYPIDSSGGDSGSPVTDAGVAVAIHTNGGCTSLGYNSGCSVRHPGLLAALASPTGVCIPHYFDVTWPSGRPSVVNPLGGTPLTVALTPRNGYAPDPAGMWLQVDFGGGFQAYPMMPDGIGGYVGAFPPMPCGVGVRYYVSLSTTTGATQVEPRGAPESAFDALSAASATVVATYDFETAAGWTVQNTNVTGGAWARGVPAGDGSRGDPTADFDGSGQCWLTGNLAGDSDVDGGPTRLLSPSWNLSTTARPVLRYARWFANDNLDADRLTVELSNNFGVNWSPIESVAHAPVWTVRYVDLAAILPPTNVVRVRFSTADDPNNSLTEAAVDAVTVYAVTCPAAGDCRKGDVNLDGRINGADIQAFVALLLSGGAPGTPAHCAADVGNPGGPGGDGSVNTLDVGPFIACALAGGCP